MEKCKQCGDKYKERFWHLGDEKICGECADMLTSGGA